MQDLDKKAELSSNESISIGRLCAYVSIDTHSHRSAATKHRLLYIKPAPCLCLKVSVISPKSLTQTPMYERAEKNTRASTQANKPSNHTATLSVRSWPSKKKKKKDEAKKKNCTLPPLIKPADLLQRKTDSEKPGVSTCGPTALIIRAFKHDLAKANCASPPKNYHPINCGGK